MSKEHGNYDPNSYEIITPFFTDDHSLAGYSRERCFALGYEYCEIVKEMDTGKAFEKPFNEENAERVTRILQLRGRQFEILEYEKRHASMGWKYLKVEAM